MSGEDMQKKKKKERKKEQKTGQKKSGKRRKNGRKIQQERRSAYKELDYAAFATDYGKIFSIFCFRVSAVKGLTI